MDKALIFIAGLILSGCVGGGVNIMGSAPTMEGFKHDLPIVRALLDSNGLSDVSEQKVALRKVDGHGYWYVLDLNNQSIEEFHFTRETKNIKALKTLNMSNNNLNGIPKGIELGKWTQIQLQYNELCSLTPTDSAFLRQIRAEFGNQNCGTI